ncbi:MAG: putative undecaprenyldiphospho-muramoylpentapeptide b-N-acetylglucosaminyltransferase [Pseudomonadota bacterium]|jgi:UDP-N-acetylglucosamine--N-acetylmuramyl-(pentapeptide) pyrophosphoryl-undecaprenol N-acetylglucosamine transferase
MSAPRHLVIMAAGTGGHIIPGLAVAREMQQRGWSVSWFGTRHGMENKLVPPSGIELDTINFAGLRGKGFKGRLTGAWQLLLALFTSRTILRRRQASVVLGMGGYVCLPGGLAASWSGRPLVLVNADAALLLSNRLLARRAARVAFGFDGVAASATARAVVTGNPVRSEIEALPAPAARFAGRSGPLRVLVVGGSLGAQVLNETVPSALALMAPDQRPQLVHQTGVAHHANVLDDYRTLGLMGQEPSMATGLDVRPFIDDMAAELAACDLLICRAGAVTVSELCAAGVPAVLVPLIVSTTSHQRDNAEWLAGHHAAIHLPQTELAAPALAALLARLDRVALLAMAERARALARPQAAQRVADEIEAVAASTASNGAAPAVARTTGTT